MRIACFIFVFVFSACQDKSEPAPAPSDPPQTRAKSKGKTPFARDLNRICNAESMSGALDYEESARAVLVAQWLGRNIESDQGRNLLAKLARTKVEEKSALLNSESSRHGMKECPTAAAWTGAGESRLQPPEQYNQE